MMKNFGCLVLIASLAASCSDSATTNPAGELDPSQQTDDGVDGEEYTGLEAAGKGDLPENFGGSIEFENACEPGEEITIAAVGDVLLHGRLQRQAYDDELGAESLWSGVTDLLQRADVTYANFEGPSAPGTNKYGRAVSDPGKVFDGTVYSSYPQFNYHPSVIDDLLRSGVDVVSTANNHSLDRRGRGVRLTIDSLESRGMPFTGTRKSPEDDRPWYTVVPANDALLAFVACTYGTNGIPDNDDQVLYCYRDADELEALVSDLSGQQDIDAVIVTPHWGEQYTAIPNERQFDLSHRLLDAGALAIIGNHPHVVQPWERYVTADGRETFAIYSIGNFVSGQRQLARRTTLVLYLGLYRAADGDLKVRGARYVPLHMTTRSDGVMTLEAIDRAGDFGDSRNHVIDLMGASNLMLPHEEIVTNPQCDPDWVPHHPHTGWVGGECSSEEWCGGETTCDGDVPGGVCTLTCDNTCPDVVGRSTTFCVDLGDGTGSCVLKCDSSTECRQGWECDERTRFNGTTNDRVCVPQESAGN